MKRLVLSLSLFLCACQSYGPSLTQLARGPVITTFSYNDVQIMVLADNAERSIIKRMDVDEALTYGAAAAGIGLATVSAFFTHGASAVILAGSGVAIPLVANGLQGANRAALYATALMNINNMIAHYLLVQGNPTTKLTPAGIDLFRNVNLAIAMLRMGSATLLPTVTSAQ
jgi:hypothetical protein